MARRKQGIEPKDELPLIQKGNPLRPIGEPGKRETMLKEEWAQMKRITRMRLLDAQPAPIRQCVHDYGYHIVSTFMEYGIKDASAIRKIVETVLDEFSPTRGSYSKQGIRTEVVK